MTRRTSGLLRAAAAAAAVAACLAASLAAPSAASSMPSALPALSAVAMCVSAALRASAFDETVRVAVPMPSSGSEAALALQERVRRGYDLWASRLNAAGGIELINLGGGDETPTANVSLTYTDAGDGSADAQREAARAIGEAGDVDAVFCPYGAEAALATAEGLVESGSSALVFTGHARAESVSIDCNGTCGGGESTVAPEPRFDAGFVNLNSGIARATTTAFAQFRISNFRRIAVLGCTDADGEALVVEELLGSFTQAARDFTSPEEGGFAMEVVFTETALAASDDEDGVDADADADADADGAAATAESVVELMRDAAVDVVAGAVTGALCQELMEAMRDAGWMPGAVYLPMCGDELAGLEVGHFVMHTAPWSRVLRGTDYKVVPREGRLWGGEANGSLTTVEDFALDFEAEYGEEPGWVEAAAAAVGFAYANLLHGSYPLPEVLKPRVQLMYEPGFYGLVSFDKFSVAVSRDWVAVQQDREGVPRVVAPVVFAATEAVLPAPTWDERVRDTSAYQTNREKVVAALTALGLVYCLGVLALIYVWRGKAPVRAGSPVLCGVVVAGAVLLLCTNFFWTINVSDAACNARVFTLGSGFILMFGSLLLKNLRVWLLFHTAARGITSMKVYSTARLLVWLGAGLLGFLFFSAVYLGVSPFEAVLSTPDLDRPSQDFTECGGGNRAYLAVTLTCMGLMIVAAAVLSIVVRQLPSAFNESSHVAMCVYIVLLAVICGVPVLASGVDETSPAAQYTVRSVLLLAVACVVVSVLMLPKFITAVYGSPDAVRRQMDVYREAEGDGGFRRRRSATNTKHPRPHRTQSDSTRGGFGSNTGTGTAPNSRAASRNARAPGPGAAAGLGAATTRTATMAPSPGAGPQSPPAGLVVGTADLSGDEYRSDESDPDRSPTLTPENSLFGNHTFGVTRTRTANPPRSNSLHAASSGDAAGGSVQSLTPPGDEASAAAAREPTMDGPAVADPDDVAVTVEVARTSSVTPGPGVRTPSSRPRGKLKHQRTESIEI